MPKSCLPFSPDFKRRMVELVRAGRTPEELSWEFETSAQAIHTTIRSGDICPAPDLVDRNLAASGPDQL